MLTQAYDHFFAEAQTNPKVVEAQWAVIRKMQCSLDIDYFIDSYLMKPLQNENAATLQLLQRTHSKQTILKLACILLNNGFNIKEIVSTPIEEVVDFSSPQQESELNDDVLDEVDDILQRQTIQVEFSTEFVQLFFMARQVKQQKQIFTHPQFNTLIVKQQLSYNEMLQLMLCCNSLQLIENMNCQTSLMLFHRATVQFEQQKINEFLDFLLLQNKENELLQRTIAQFYKTEAKMEISVLSVVKNQKLAAKITEKDQIYQLLMKSDDFQDETIEILLKKASSVFEVDKPTAEDFQIVNLLFDSYDVSPRLCGQLNSQLEQFQQIKPTFYMQSAYYLILMGYNRIENIECIKQVETMLQNAPATLVEDYQNNHHLEGFYFCLLRIIMRLTLEEYKIVKKTVNKLTKFVINFPFETNDIYVMFYQLFLEQFQEQNESVNVIFSQIQTILDLASTPGQIYKKGFLTSIIALFGFEYENILMKSDQINSKQLIQFIKTEFETILISKDNEFFIIQLVKLLRNCSMHQNFKPNADLIEVYQKFTALIEFLLQQKPSLQSEAVISAVLALFNSGLIKSTISQFKFDGKFTKTTSTKLEQQNYLLKFQETIAQQILLQEWNDSNSAEITQSYFDDLVEQKIFKLGHSTVVKIQQMFDEMIEPEEENGEVE